MKTNEIKRTIEQVVRVEYIAEDGVIFDDEKECIKYEESALFVVSHKLKRLTNEWTSHAALFEDRDEEELEIFDIQTEEDLENLRRYLYLKATKNGASDKYVKDCFTSENGNRNKYVFDNVTIGHEVLIFWGYDQDWFWVYNDGSLDGYFEWVREKYLKIITPENAENNEGDNK
jgi:hypothetical protein